MFLNRIFFRYIEILKNFDLSDGFYFSISYDLTNPLSTNILRNMPEHLKMK